MSNIRNGELFLASCLRIQDDYQTKIALPAKIAGIALWILGSFPIAWGILCPYFESLQKSILIILGGFALILAGFLLDPHSKVMLRLQNVLCHSHGQRMEMVSEEWKEIRLDEMTSWCENAFSSFAEHRGYWGEPPLKRSVLYRENVQEGVRIFSFGLMIPDPAAYTVPDAFTEKYTEQNWKERCEKEKKRIEELSLIWKSVLYPAKLPSTAWTKNKYLGWVYDRNEVEELGEKLGIQQMVEAYVSGVPLVDIIA